MDKKSSPPLAHARALAAGRTHSTASLAAAHSGSHDLAPGGQMGICPNFYIVGAAKCGTTTLYWQFRKHPQVFLPEMKEPHFFVNRPSPLPISECVPRDTCCCGDQERYQRLYETANGAAAIGDASVSYLWDQMAPQRIYEACPEAKIVIILRDPVIRAHSHYLNYRKDATEPEPSFLKALQLESAQTEADWFISRLYITASLYYAQVNRFLNLFGKRQVLVLLFEDLQKNPQELFSKTARHIGVDPGLLDRAGLSRAYNIYSVPRFRAVRLARRAGLRGSILPRFLKKRLKPLLFEMKKPELDSESRHYLQQIFEPDIARLEDLLGRKFPELRKSWV
jgi:hypothetical protein